MEATCSPDLKCVLKCALNISCLEMDVYLILLKNPGLDVETIAKELEKDESTVYKALRNLMERGLVKREYRILKGGGTSTSTSRRTSRSSKRLLKMQWKSGSGILTA